MFESMIFLRGMSMGILLLLGCIALIHLPRQYDARMLAALAIGVGGYLLAPILHGQTSFFYVAVAIADLTPVIFLLFTQAVFSDHRGPAMYSLLAGAAYYICGYTASFWFGDGSGVEADTLHMISRAIILGVVLYAMYIIASHWRSDLVEGRRQLRLILTSVVCTYIIAVVIVELLSPSTPLWFELLHSIGILLVTLVFSLGVILLREEPSVDSGPKNIAGNEPTVLQQRELASLLDAVEQDYCYREMSLTLRSLSDLLRIPEHHLRALINQQLGYRNFNDFLNHYRVQDAAMRLCNADFAHLPILTIAMDSGYRSMTTFNKAFKAEKSVTPSEYRQKQQRIS